MLAEIGKFALIVIFSLIFMRAVDSLSRMASKYMASAAEKRGLIKGREKIVLSPLLEKTINAMGLASFCVLELLRFDGYSKRERAAVQFGIPLAFLIFLMTPMHIALFAGADIFVFAGADISEWLLLLAIAAFFALMIAYAFYCFSYAGYVFYRQWTDEKHTLKSRVLRLQGQFKNDGNLPRLLCMAFNALSCAAFLAYGVFSDMPAMRLSLFIWVLLALFLLNSFLTITAPYRAWSPESYDASDKNARDKKTLRQTIDNLWCVLMFGAVAIFVFGHNT